MQCTSDVPCLSKIDSAAALRLARVPYAKRLKVIRAALNNKFSLHQQGVMRIDRAGNKATNEVVSCRKRCRRDCKH